MTKLIVAVVACLLLMGDGAPTSCFEGALQNDIDFEKIAGKWNQAYFTAGSVFGEAFCIESEIYNVSKASTTLEMLTKVVIPENPTHVGTPLETRTTQTVHSTANWSDDKSERKNLKNHVVTDYDTYLIFYYCNSGRQFLDVRVRNGKQLHLRQIREVAEIADRLRSSFFDLHERVEVNCDVYKSNK